MEVTSFSTDATVAPGTHFSIVVDVQPKPGMHVYAPGVTGYRPVNLTIDPARWIALSAAIYPPSEDYHFKPLDEHVPVYVRRFRIAEDVVVDASPEAQNALKDISSIKLRGVLSYQACDDRVCFSPQTVPLEWTVAVRQLDRERVKR
ncbi:MAG TPA: protein-disulfide reductase DsbD domain-containing protein [Vicinamibacterales bacterium]|nr:protein-disulfide reductase DsbD domain-containing protein [Vicinamibacterales bacterium]